MPIRKAPSTKQLPGDNFATFSHNGLLYEHRIFTSESLLVACVNHEGEVVLTFMPDCSVIDRHHNVLGTLNYSVACGHVWIFEQGHKEPIILGDDLLKAEVEVSKLYLSGDLV